ncbi:hypothetical protein [Streptomyces pactum]|uniref:hypothetical protein n=1 Tax=Streptomyces pactum TaxID=68249 RepID=UPI001F220655|nr:hypothetical protein [Streptomyces pactum]
MKDVMIGILVALAMLAIFIAVFWTMAASSEADRDDCQSEADKYGNRATCIVVVR